MLTTVASSILERHQSLPLKGMNAYSGYEFAILTWIVSVSSTIWRFMEFLTIGMVFTWPNIRPGIYFAVQEVWSGPRATEPTSYIIYETVQEQLTSQNARTAFKGSASAPFSQFSEKIKCHLLASVVCIKSETSMCHCAPNSKNTQIEEPKHRVILCAITPNDPMGDSLLPISTVLGCAGIEVLKPKKVVLLPRKSARILFHHKL